MTRSCGACAVSLPVPGHLSERVDPVEPLALAVLATAGGETLGRMDELRRELEQGRWSMKDSEPDTRIVAPELAISSSGSSIVPAGMALARCRAVTMASATGAG